MGRFQKTNAQSYIEGLFAQETPLLNEIRTRLEADNDWAMHISPMEGKILQFLIKLAQPQKVVEIGTLYGYSTLWMAEALPDTAKIYALEKMDPFYKIAQTHFEKSEHGHKIELLLGDAKESLPLLEGPFDMIFIDADKSHYLEYLDWAEQNIRVGGLIIGDNTLLFGHMYGEGDDIPKTTNRQRHNMKEFNERLANSDKFDSVILPTQEGMTVAIKK